MNRSPAPTAVLPVAVLACAVMWSGSALSAQSEQGSPFQTPTPFIADGEIVIIKNNAFTRPMAQDFDQDGLLDLVLGWYDYDRETKVATQQGRIYLNQGAPGSPEFGEPIAITVDGSVEIWDTY